MLATTIAAALFAVVAAPALAQNSEVAAGRSRAHEAKKSRRRRRAERLR